MSRCLGLYIENNVIKYAKIYKEHEDIKIEAFGIKFDDNINNAIRQIVAETNSNKVPISINLVDEEYTYANLSKLLKEKDLTKAVSTEFDFFCKEQRKIRSGIQYKNIIVSNLENKDKVTSLYAYVDKSNIVSRTQLLNGYTVSNLTPLPISITNLNKYNTKNSVIVNIDRSTSVTFMEKDKIQKVETIKIGMKDILDKIAKKEKSYAKAYEICKNATIYSEQINGMQIEENDYMEDIMVTLYQIVENVQKIINKCNLPIENIYITGLATAINNIDLYFQDNFSETKCEILKPYFTNKTSNRINLKDYIEVNSAIALALEGVGLGHKEMNFKNVEAINGIKNLFIVDLNNGLDKIEKNMIRFATALLILIIVYGIFSNIIMGSINNKNVEIQSYISRVNDRISEINKNNNLVNARKDQYESLITKLEESTNAQTQSYARKNALPNLLTEVMYNIPKEVQLLSIENPKGKSITIQARSKEYEQLGYFIAKIKNEGLLTNVTSTSGVKQGNYVVIAISGDLVY